MENVRAIAWWEISYLSAIQTDRQLDTTVSIGPSPLRGWSKKWRGKRGKDLTKNGMLRYCPVYYYLSWRKVVHIKTCKDFFARYRWREKRSIHLLWLKMWREKDFFLVEKWTLWSYCSASSRTLSTGTFFRFLLLYDTTAMLWYRRNVMIP